MCRLGCGAGGARGPGGGYPLSARSDRAEAGQSLIRWIVWPAPGRVTSADEVKELGLGVVSRHTVIPWRAKAKGYSGRHGTKGERVAADVGELG
jgi:hypothetical protein